MIDTPILTKPKLVTIAQAARLMHLHPESIRRLVRQGKLPDRRIPGTRKILLYTSDLVAQ